MAVFTDAREELHPFTVEGYALMFEHGILSRRDPVELLDGVLIGVSPESEPHQHVVALLNRLLVLGLPDDLLVRINGPLEVRPASVPQPDFAVIPRPRRPLEEAPGSALLAIEVSFTSLRKDLSRKARIYASAGVPEYWVFDLTRAVVHVHLEPRDGRYRSIREIASPESLQSVSIPLPPIALADLFG